MASNMPRKNFKKSLWHLNELIKKKKKYLQESKG